MTKSYEDQLWLVCPCRRWFRQPSAVKQHLSHKTTEGPHPDETGLAAINFDSLWDDTWAEMNRLQKLRHDKSTPIDSRPSPRSQPAKRALSPEENWPEDVPRPPKPPTDPSAKRRLVEEGWMEPVPTAVVELLSFESFQRARNTKLERDHWYDIIGPISEQIGKELLPDHHKTACYHLDQVQDLDPLEFELKADWSPDDILAYTTSVIGMNFTSLGSRWMITYQGSHVNKMQQWLHFNVVFSQGFTPEGAPVGKVVGIESLPSEVQALVSLKKAIPLRDKIVTALAQVVDSSVAPGERTVSHVDAANERKDSHVEAANVKPIPVAPLTSGQTGLGKVPVVAVVGTGPSIIGGGTQDGYHDELAIDLLEAAVQAEQKIKAADQGEKKEADRNVESSRVRATAPSSGSVAPTIVDETPEVSGNDVQQSGVTRDQPADVDKPAAESAEPAADGQEGAGAAEHTGGAPAVTGILQPVQKNN